MALYTILFGICIFMIALTLAIIKRMFFHWKAEHKIDTMAKPYVDRPAVCAVIYIDKCVLRRREFADATDLYDVIEKSDVSVTKHDALAEDRSPCL